jgi:3-deoxy-manno-octulosonate cytidylyltransferase (CMP-KDO synthetase)
MNSIGIIPARMASSRFPGKPLAEINGIPMVGHVYFRSKMSRTLDEVYVATCDEEIRKYVEGVGGRVVMTKDTHERASDRTAEAMLKVEEARGAKVDIVVMIQGDEPMLLPQMIDEAVNPLRSETGVNVVNLMAPLRSKEEHEDPNEVKVVVDQEGFAMYFSREPIPSRKKWKEQIPMFKQVCIIPFRREYLIRFNELVSTPLEKVESVDMLRVLEHGEKVRMVLTAFETYSVDTPEDLRKVARMMTGDSLVAQYSRKA